ncbi:MAG: hypothetical protein ABJB12_03440 [Pseudomonadota bacterium]
MRAHSVVTCLMASGLLLACGDGGAPGGPPDIGEERPPPSTQDARASAQRPPQNAERAPQNAQDPPEPRELGSGSVATGPGSTPIETHGDGGADGK